ncbi:TfdA family Taurine catabolism dioxygenase TauD [Ilyonectria robusta]
MSCVKTSPISYLLPDIQRVSFASEFPPSPFEELVKLPQGFPEFVDKPLAWKGHQFADETEYIYTLNTFEIGELECALGSFKGPQLRILRHDIYNGKGFGVIRGLCPQRYSVEDLTILYLGLQSYIANQRGRQDEKGNMLGTHSLQTPWEY